MNDLDRIMFDRFITVMIYLNDVEEGGETAFPAAHNETYDNSVSSGFSRCRKATTSYQTYSFSY